MIGLATSLQTTDPEKDRMEATELAALRREDVRREGVRTMTASSWSAPVQQVDGGRRDPAAERGATR